MAGLYSYTTNLSYVKSVREKRFIMSKENQTEKDEVEEKEISLDDCEQVSGGKMKGNIVFEETKPVSGETKSQM